VGRYYSNKQTLQSILIFYHHGYPIFDFKNFRNELNLSVIFTA